MEDFIAQNMDRFHNIIQEQIFLQENGVSFSYTDELTFYDRQALISDYTEFIKIRNEKNQEIIDKRNNK